jgi:hypothetical protein
MQARVKQMGIRQTATAVLLLAAIFLQAVDSKV